MKICSLNVNGIRAAYRRGVEDFFKDFDVFCLQEIKADAELFSNITKYLAGSYHIYVNAAEKAGYSGVAVFTKTKPLKVLREFPNQSLVKNEGRVLVIEFETFFLVNCYVPHGGKRLELKLAFLKELKHGLDELKKIKPVVLAGDINIAHTEQDCSHPKLMSKITGFLPEERRCFDELLAGGFTDAFRYINPTSTKHSWSSYRTKASSYRGGFKSYTYRFDYFLADERLANTVSGSDILHNIFYSDHYPIVLTFNPV